MRPDPVTGGSMTTINPTSIPVFDGDLTVVATAATRFIQAGTQVERAGVNVHARFQGLAGCYQAPEAGDLLTSTAPVRRKAAEFGDDLTTVGRALATYVYEMRSVASRLDAVQSEACEFVVKQLPKGEDWDKDPAAVARNNELLQTVNALVVAKAAVERDCANAINRLVGGPTWQAAGRGTGPFQYGPSVISPAVSMPWGRPVEPDRPWWQDAWRWGKFGVGVGWQTYKSFGKGFWVDGLGGMLYGMWVLSFGRVLWTTAKQLTGHGGQEESKQASVEAGRGWAELGKTAAGLILYTNPAFLPGTALALTNPTTRGWVRGPTDALVRAGKGFIAWDTWKHDPARAMGATTFNVLTTVLPTKGLGALGKGTGAVDDVTRATSATESGATGASSAAAAAKQGSVRSKLGDLPQSSARPLPTVESLRRALPDADELRVGRQPGPASRDLPDLETVRSPRDPAETSGVEVPPRSRAPEERVGSRLEDPADASRGVDSSGRAVDPPVPPRPADPANPGSHGPSRDAATSGEGRPSASEASGIQADARNLEPAAPSPGDAAGTAEPSTSATTGRPAGRDADVTSLDNGPHAGSSSERITDTPAQVDPRSHEAESGAANQGARSSDAASRRVADPPVGPRDGASRGSARLPTGERLPSPEPRRGTPEAAAVYHHPPESPRQTASAGRVEPRPRSGRELGSGDSERSTAGAERRADSGDRAPDRQVLPDELDRQPSRRGVGDDAPTHPHPPEANARSTSGRSNAPHVESRPGAGDHVPDRQSLPDPAARQPSRRGAGDAAALPPHPPATKPPATSGSRIPSGESRPGSGDHVPDRQSLPDQVGRQPSWRGAGDVAANRPSPPETSTRQSLPDQVSRQPSRQGAGDGPPDSPHPPEADRNTARHADDAHQTGHEPDGSSGDRLSDQPARQLTWDDVADYLPTDRNGYQIRPRDCEYLGITPQQVYWWKTRQAPLGMTPQQYTQFRTTLREALLADGIDPADVDVRLQGSAARFFSGAHKHFPAPGRKGWNPTVAERIAEWFGNDPARPARRPFDSGRKLGIDKNLSDYDVQISSDKMVEKTYRVWLMRGSEKPFIRAKYGFVERGVFQRAFPNLLQWRLGWQKHLRRQVPPALFGSSGPPAKSRTGMSAAHHSDDWIVHLTGDAST